MVYSRYVGLMRFPERENSCFKYLRDVLPYLCLFGSERGGKGISVQYLGCGPDQALNPHQDKLSIDSVTCWTWSSRRNMGNDGKKIAFVKKYKLFVRRDGDRTSRFLAVSVEEGPDPAAEKSERQFLLVHRTLEPLDNFRPSNDIAASVSTADNGGVMIGSDVLIREVRRSLAEIPI